MLILNGVGSGQHLWDEQCLPSTLGYFHKKLSASYNTNT